ncbi:MAG: hypothetical protein IJX78_06345 [Bacilli bacterium]|nr:hypothetical protein [Bacilli bacterium]
MEKEIQQEELIEYSFSEQEGKEFVDYERKNILKLMINSFIIFGYALIAFFLGAKWAIYISIFPLLLGIFCALSFKNILKNYKVIKETRIPNEIKIMISDDYIVFYEKYPNAEAKEIVKFSEFNELRETESLLAPVKGTAAYFIKKDALGEQYEKLKRTLLLNVKIYNGMIVKEKEVYENRFAYYSKDSKFINYSKANTIRNSVSLYYLLSSVLICLITMKLPMPFIIIAGASLFVIGIGCLIYLFMLDRKIPKNCRKHFDKIIIIAVLFILLQLSLLLIY